MLRTYLIRIPLLFILFFAFKSSAQPYNTGIGLRLGGISSGITVKHFVNSNSALEGIVSFRSHSFFITGLYERHQSFPNAEGLSWFFGGGAHIGFFDDHHYEHFYHTHHKHKDDDIFDDGDSDISFGADFILGLDYKFKNAPVDIALDVKPFVDIVPGFYGYWEGALTIRFTL